MLNKKIRWAQFLSLPALLLYGMFFVYPLLRGIGMSFTDWDGMGESTFVGLRNFIDFFHDARAIHDIKTTLVFAGGTATFKKHLVLGADGRGTLVREGAAGTFKVTGNLVLSNTVENAASGGTLKFVYDETDGIAPLAVSGKLVIRPGAKIEVDLGDYATQKSYKAKHYLVQPTGGVEGDFSSVARSVVGARADEAVVDVDANGVYAHVPRGAVILVR